jgi:HSP20 family protein
MNIVPRNSLFDFDHLLNGFWSPSREISDSTDVAFSPRVDIEEKKDSYKITAELPGVDRDDVRVSLENGVLSIEAESHQEETEEQDGRIIRQERRYGKFIRSFNLGSNASEKDIKAKFKNGILTIKAPCSKPLAPESHRISID